MKIFTFLIHGYFWIGVLTGWVASPILKKLWIKVNPLLNNLLNKIVSKIKK
jgi:hypothetical protein